MRNIGLLLIALLVAIAVGAAAQNERVYSAKGDDYLLPFPETTDIVKRATDADCTTYDGCPEDLEGIAWRDHHIGPHTEDAENDLWYFFYSYGYVHAINYNKYVVAWDLCMFDDQKQFLGCNSHEGKWLNRGRLDIDTEYLRIILRQGFNHEASLSVYI